MASERKTDTDMEATSSAISGDTFKIQNFEDFQFSKPSEVRVRKVQVGAGGSLKINVSTASKVKKDDSDTASVTSEGSVKCGISTDGNETIISIMGNILDELERVYEKRRTEVVTSDGFLSTPLHVLKTMAEDFDMKLHSELFMMYNPEKGNKMSRVELFVGNFRGEISELVRSYNLLIYVL